jgi:hypothetical protein
LATATPQILQETQRVGPFPRLVPQFHDDAEGVLKLPHDLADQLAIGGTGPEIVAKLGQQVLELAGLQERGESLVKLLHHEGVDLALMGKTLVQLGREEKLRQRRGPFQPGPRHPFARRAVKPDVDIDAIHEPADVLQMVRLGVRVDDPVPVRIGPAAMPIWMGQTIVRSPKHTIQIRNPKHEIRNKHE